MTTLAFLAGLIVGGFMGIAVMAFLAGDAE